MNLDTFTTILVAIIPALTAVATIVGGLIKIASMLKKNTKDTTDKLEAKTDKMEKSFDDIAMLKTKINSIEKYLVDKERKK